MIKEPPQDQDASPSGVEGDSDHSAIGDLLSRLTAGDPIALAHCLTLVEKGSAPAALISALEPSLVNESKVIGITGTPGVGKSTLTGRLISEFRSHDLSVGVIAVDPSSPLRGGAVLGDRIRMTEHDGDSGVFIRSLASRGLLGGLAPTISSYIKLMKASGREIIIIETVGIGQSEIEVCKVADTTALISAPGMGDDLQTLKGGILEVADILVLNKSDLPTASVAFNQLLSISKREGQRKRELPILMTQATTGQGVAGLAEALLNRSSRSKSILEPPSSDQGRVKQALSLLLFERVQRLTPAKARELLELLQTEDAGLSNILRMLLKTERDQ